MQLTVHFPLPLRRATALLALLVMSASSRGADFSGHWEGSALVPGTPLAIVLDFDFDGVWKGWATLPGHGVSGVPLRALAMTDESLRADLSAAIASGGEREASEVVLHLDGGHLTGHLQQGGHRAALALDRAGEAQVPTVRPNTPIDAKLGGAWYGIYILGGRSRAVTLTLKPGPPSAEMADLLIVGRSTTHVLLDQVQPVRNGVSLGSSESGVSIDVRRRTFDDALEGTFQQGPYEAPLVLRRTKASR